MRAFLRFALPAALLFAQTPAPAQGIANLDFEIWGTRTSAVVAGVEAPANWQTFDDVVSSVFGVPLPASSNTVIKSPDAHGGSYAARLETKSFALLGTTVPGALALGSRYLDFGSLYSGVPYTARPTQLQFYYKLSGPGAATDGAGVSVSLTRTTGGVSTDLVLMHQPLAPTATYALATVPLAYLSAATPDSVHIEFYTAFAPNPAPGTVLLIDDVSFATPTATRGGRPNVAVSVAPNPSADGCFLLHSPEPAVLAAPFTVTDVRGRVVLQAPAAGPATSRALNLGTQAAGLYSLQLQTDKGVVVLKLVVR